MNIEEFRTYCLSKKGAIESFPFDETTLVFKVMGKIFALTDIADEFCINLKADPEQVVIMREHFDAVLPGYHMSKKHWNTIIMDRSPGDDLITQWIDDSYFLVVRNLTKKQQQEIGLL